MEYSPQINQFLVSNEREQESYFIADLTAKAEIKSVTIFAMVISSQCWCIRISLFYIIALPSTR